jgi:tetratricopeptide (TPR) repeat protein
MTSSCPHVFKTTLMKTIFAITLILGFTSCSTSKEKAAPVQEPKTDNVELIEIYKNDQADRQSDNIDWSVVSVRDSLREVRVYQLLDSNKVRTARDYNHAAMIFQHGRDSIAYGMAVKLMLKSLELDSTANKWLLAAAIDRDLLSRNKPQIYGTQYFKMNEEPWQLREIDSTQITDAERIEYGVETLAQQREKVKAMNRKQLSELLAEGKTIDEVLELINSEMQAESEFDISESGINNFGYHLISQGKEKEALEVFKLNTELYPNGFNTWDSYGECLLALGKKEEGIEAYRKSFELNPKNKLAEAIVTEHK